MPSVTKQTMKPQTRKIINRSVLGRIHSLVGIERGVRLSLYGRPKTGKTRLACTFPKPLILIGTEDGTESVVGIKGIDFVLLDRCEEIKEIIQGPVAAGKYATVVLDNGTRFRDMRISEILGLDRVPVQKGWGFAKRDHWIECANSTKEMLRPLFDLAKKTDLNLVIIAQEQNYSDGVEGSSSDLITPSISSALGKSVCDWVNAECDCIGQTLIRPQIVEKHVKVAGKTSTVKSRTGKKEYCLRVGPDEVYYAGFRLRGGRVLMEDFIVDPTYEKIKAVIDGTFEEEED